jgi:stage II sporulation protein D
MKRWWIAFILGLSQITLASAQQSVRVGLFESELPQSVEVTTVAGAHEWVDAQGQVIGPLRLKQVVSATGERLRLGDMALDYVYLRPTVPQSRVQLRALGKYPTVHTGRIHFLMESGGIRCVLEAELESYLEGVLSAESGKGHHPEYYRAQAVVSRTYTVQAMGRHRMQGFDVCDAVHCQAYHGVGTVNDTLQKAVASTRGTLLVDRQGRPITAAFHSNCGGQTQGAENVWQRPLDYLVGVPDTFCLAMPHAQWTRSVPSADWRDWLVQRRAGSSERTTFLPNERFDALPDSGSRVRAIEARSAFGLQSSYFVAVDDGAEVRFMGQGFGHGVGLCQEGAMQRAVHGETYDRILHHYYTGVRLTSLESLNLFRGD